MLGAHEKQFSEIFDSSDTMSTEALCAPQCPMP